MRLTSTSAGVAWLGVVALSYALNIQGGELAAVLALVIPGAVLYSLAKAQDR